MSNRERFGWGFVGVIASLIGVAFTFSFIPIMKNVAIAETTCLRQEIRSQYVTSAEYKEAILSIRDNVKEIKDDIKDIKKRRNN